jgi:hypothetical protein
VKSPTVKVRFVSRFFWGLLFGRHAADAPALLRRTVAPVYELGYGCCRSSWLMDSDPTA